MPADTKSELAPILTGAAIFPLDDRAFLRITGSDATRWLNGMVTNSIQSLAPGEGNYNFLLNAQGRIQGDCTIYREYREPESGDARFLLETDSSQIEALQQHLDRFIIMDDVELSTSLEIYGRTVPTNLLKGFAITGDKAGEMFGTVMCELCHEFLMVDAPKPGSLIWGTQGDKTPTFILAPPNQPKTYEIWSSSLDLDAVRSEFERLGARQISSEAIEALRILEGRPRFGTDIREKDLPQETNQTHALHFSKGCYLGQEIVERIRSRGQVHRTFSGFHLTALPASLPAPLISDGKPAGEITSAATIGDQTFALGYIRREALDRNQPLDYEGGTANPATLPFRMTTS